MHTSAESAISVPDECAAAARAGAAHQTIKQKVVQQMEAAGRPGTRAESAPARGFDVRTFLLLFTMMFFCTAGNALLDKTMKGVGEVNLASAPAIWSAVARTFASGTIWVGLGFLTFFMASQMVALSRADYSFVIPFSAMSYALVPLVGYLWLGEAVSQARWIGIALIMCGVVLVSRTPPNTTDPAGATGSGGASRGGGAR